MPLVCSQPETEFANDLREIALYGAWRYPPPPLSEHVPKPYLSGLLRSEPKACNRGSPIHRQFFSESEPCECGVRSRIDQPTHGFFFFCLARASKGLRVADSCWGSPQLISRVSYYLGIIQVLVLVSALSFDDLRATCLEIHRIVILTLVDLHHS